MLVESESRIWACLEKFILWLNRYGETSYDHQSFYAGSIGRRAKSLYYTNPLVGIFAVSPMVFFEAFFPSGRRLFWKKQRFPIADAHYAMGFALLAKSTGEQFYYDKAVHFLNELKLSRAPGFEHYCWGYPFDWVTRNGTISANAPFITTLPYCYEAFEYVYNLDRDERWLDVMRSIAEHALRDIKDFEVEPGCFSCGYGPYDDSGGVVNASAYRAFLLMAAYFQFKDEGYLQAARCNLKFIQKTQLPDGSWPYAVDGERHFIDHFHTCFVLKALGKIEKLTGWQYVNQVIEKGAKFYLNNLLDGAGLPKPFALAPRMTVYRRELYDYAECINLCLLLQERISEMQITLERVIGDLLRRWIKGDGSFRSRELLLGWDNVPMHRWAQSQLFRSLCFYLSQGRKQTDAV